MKATDFIEAKLPTNNAKKINAETMRNTLNAPMGIIGNLILSDVPVGNFSDVYIDSRGKKTYQLSDLNLSVEDVFDETNQVFLNNLKVVNPITGYMYNVENVTASQITLSWTGRRMFMPQMAICVSSNNKNIFDDKSAYLPLMPVPGQSITVVCDQDASIRIQFYNKSFDATVGGSKETPLTFVITGSGDYMGCRIHILNVVETSSSMWLTYLFETMKSQSMDIDIPMTKLKTNVSSNQTITIGL